MSHAIHGDKGNPVMDRELSRIKLEVASVNTKLERLEETLGQVLAKMRVDDSARAVPRQRVAHVSGALTQAASNTRPGSYTAATVDETVSL